jgi:hypothetical protein
MPRRLRIEFEGAIYHVMARGDARQNIVHDGEDRVRSADLTIVDFAAESGEVSRASREA